MVYYYYHYQLALHALARFTILFKPLIMLILMYYHQSPSILYKRNLILFRPFNATSFVWNVKKILLDQAHPHLYIRHSIIHAISASWHNFRQKFEYEWSYQIIANHFLPKSAPCGQPWTYPMYKIERHCRRFLTQVPPFPGSATVHFC